MNKLFNPLLTVHAAIFCKLPSLITRRRKKRCVSSITQLDHKTEEKALRERTLERKWLSSSASEGTSSDAGGFRWSCLAFRSLCWPTTRRGRRAKCQKKTGTCQKTLIVSVPLMESVLVYSNMCNTIARLYTRTISEIGVLYPNTLHILCTLCLSLFV